MLLQAANYLFLGAYRSKRMRNLTAKRTTHEASASSGPELFHPDAGGIVEELDPSDSCCCCPPLQVG
jgi:hypothetical protein